MSYQNQKRQRGRGRGTTNTTSSALSRSTFESGLCLAASMIASTIFHASRKEAAADLRYVSLEISRACERRVVIYSPTYIHYISIWKIKAEPGKRMRTTSFARRSENKSRTCEAGGKTRTALAPCSSIACKMTSINSSMARKSN